MPPPIGVVASNLARANELIRDLGLTNARALSTRVTSIEGLRLHAVIVDASAMPLPAQYEAVLRYSLRKTPGNAGLYELRHRD